MGDLCEVILTHGSLFDSEWTVVRRHDIQSVTVANKSEMDTFQQWKETITVILLHFMLFQSVSSLSQQAH